jgi:hypothetical protein
MIRLLIPEGFASDKNTQMILKNISITHATLMFSLDVAGIIVDVLNIMLYILSKLQGTQTFSLKV